MLAPIIVLLVVVVDASADMLTTSTGLGLGMPEKNRVPRWFFARFGKKYGPAIYFPIEILIIYLSLSLLYTILFPTWGSLVATNILVVAALVLTITLIGNNTIHVMQRRRRLANTSTQA